VRAQVVGAQAVVRILQTVPRQSTYREGSLNMNNIVSKLCAAALLLSATGVANASVNFVPEPGILELTALAAVVGYIVHKRRK
jgi:hypothetical protein